MDLDEAHRYFRDRALEIRAECCHESPWVFLNAAAFIEYLAKATTASGRYDDFVEAWLARVRPKYKSFSYGAGTDDLPHQMWHILRNGLVHSFSLVPDRDAGRPHSIVLCHRSEGLTHLSRHSGHDAAVFVAEDLTDDLVLVVDVLFDEAARDTDLARRIANRLKSHPPLTTGT